MLTSPAQIAAFEPGADKVISLYQAAELSGVSASTLKRRARAGELKVLEA